jgi:MGT family glycosyltransferase
MAKILIATVPLTGHVNPGLTLAKVLIERGHKVIWYCGKDFRTRIEATGASFVPYKLAWDYNDTTINKKHLGVTKIGALRQGIYYFKTVFYGQMNLQCKDLEEIILNSPPDLILTDWMFMGAITLAEKKKIKWAIYSNSPIFYLSDDAPAPGGGIKPDGSDYGKYRNRTVNWLIRYILFSPVQRFLNMERAKVGLPPVKAFFLDHNVNICNLFLQFATEKIEYHRSNLPDHVFYVGPIPPPVTMEIDYPWWHKFKEDKPVVFITQGTLDIDNINKLVIPSLHALKDMDLVLLVTTAGKDTELLRKEFNYPNIIIEEYIPYSRVMPFVDVLISNGGYGGVMNALSYGVPVIIAGNSEEKRDVASRLEFSGAGLNLKTGTPKPGKIVNAVRKILSDPKYRLKALEIKADFDKHDAVMESVELIEELCSR